jgi:hypothetical protein
MNNMARHLIMVRITPRVMGNMIRQGAMTSSCRCVRGIPAEALIVAAGYDNSRDVFTITFEHDSFALVNEGDCIPVLIPEFSKAPA